MGITITDAAIQKRLDLIKKQYFGGSETKYQAQLKKQDLTDTQVRNDVRQQLISEAVFAKVTKNTKVPDNAVQSYYRTHKSVYTQLPTRDVRHILVKSASLAQSLYSQLKAGNDKTWCTLAKKYSQDPSSKKVCGKLTVPKGQTVPEFDKVAFSAPTNVVQKPVHNAQYGWFVIEPLSKVKPKSSTPEKKVAATIRQQLLQQKKNQVMTDWIASLSKGFCSRAQGQVPGWLRAEPGPLHGDDDQRDDQLGSGRSRKRSSSSRS